MSVRSAGAGTRFGWMTVSAAYLAANIAVHAASHYLSLNLRPDPWFPGAGLGLALLIAQGVGFAPLVAAGTLFNGWLFHPELRAPSPAMALLIATAVITAAGYAVAALVFRRVGRLHPGLGSLRDMVGFALIGLTAPLPIQALVLSVERVLLGPTVSGLGASLADYMAQDAISIIVFTPLLLVVLPPVLAEINAVLDRRTARRPAGFPGGPKGPKPLWLAEALGQLAIVLASVALVLRTPQQGELHLLYLFFVPLIWISLRHGVRGAVVGNFIICSAAAIAVRLSSTSPLRQSEIELFTLALATSGLFLGVEVEARQRVERSLRREIGERRHAEEALRQSRDQMEVRVAERTNELATVLEISQNLASTLDLRPLLDLILDQLRRLIPCHGAGIYDVTGDMLTTLDYHSATGDGPALPLRVRVDEAPLLGEVLRRRQPIMVDDIWGDSELARRFQTEAAPQHRATLADTRSWMGLPLLAKGQLVGLLRLDSDMPGFFTLHHAELAMAVANHAAVAIENARLYEEAQGKAALDERQRLARELHDSVSQVLYGIGLGANTAKQQLARDPALAAEPLDYVIGLTKAGLTEMKALIFELRPESLATEGLTGALTKQAEALQARYGLDVTIRLDGEPDASLPVKETAYLVAREAMHNVVKHAKASHVTLVLEERNGQVCLEVRDDGAGFDPGADYPGHLGLRSMRERVARLGGSLTITSTPGRGTTVGVSLPARIDALPEGQPPRRER